MRVFTGEELAKYDGTNGVAYVACDGKVYDVSGSFQWQGGEHQASHPAGRDLTREMELAPHGADLLERFPVVGTLADTPG